MLIKGMQVRVISGAHKGQEGKVLFSSPKKQRVIVEGVNFIKKSTRPSQQNPNGGKLKGASCMFLMSWFSRMAIFRIGYKLRDDGSKVRILKNK